MADATPQKRGLNRYTGPGPRVLIVCRGCQKQMWVQPYLKTTKTACSKRCSNLGRPNHRRGVTPSEETKAKLRASQLGRGGENHWNWRGGKRSERKIAMARDPYIQWRKAVFERDDYTCRECGERGGQLHADHIQPWSLFPALRYDLNNGRVLCVPCHHKTPSFPAKLIPKEMRFAR